jgi:aryl-alcohol dehydrogenase-like predicted oxidoreductase
MNSRALGKTGIEVSEVGLGAWQLGEPSWNGPGEQESLRIVDEALALGCTFVDTAPAYGGGRSEALLGQALEGRRGQVVVCTKFGYWPNRRADFSPERIEESVEGSLRRLRTDYLDVLLIHSPPDPTVLDASAPHYVTLERLKAEGVVRAYGASLTDDSTAELDRVLKTTSEVVEVRFNALHQEPLAGIEHAAEQGLGVIVKVPLESGWLSGRYRAQSTFDDTRSRWTPQEIRRRARLVQEFQRILPEGTPPTHGALQFILAQSAVSTVAPGAKSVGQLRENAAAADGSLPSDAVAAIRDLWKLELRNEPLAW